MSFVIAVCVFKGYLPMVAVASRRGPSRRERGEEQGAGGRRGGLRAASFLEKRS